MDKRKVRRRGYAFPGIIFLLGALAASLSGCADPGPFTLSGEVVASTGEYVLVGLWEDGQVPISGGTVAPAHSVEVLCETDIVSYAIEGIPRGDWYLGIFQGVDAGTTNLSTAEECFGGATTYQDPFPLKLVSFTGDRIQDVALDDWVIIP
ncbi:MAG: hypothetical protein JXA15_04825 [Spirochaetales bacterium]|nr:hypothetical protein [Spirochaetales bacterium]